MDFYKKMLRLKETSIIEKIVNIRHLNEALEFADNEDEIKVILDDSILIWVEREYNGRLRLLRPGFAGKKPPVKFRAIGGLKMHIFILRSKFRRGEWLVVAREIKQAIPPVFTKKCLGNLRDLPVLILKQLIKRVAVGRCFLCGGSASFLGGGRLTSKQGRRQGEANDPQQVMSHHTPPSVTAPCYCVKI